MGSSQSVPLQNASPEQLIDQLRSIRMQEDASSDNIEKGYVQIEKEGDGHLYFDGSSLKIDTAKQWEKVLLADPKNRLALSALLTNPITSIVTQTQRTFDDQQVFNVQIPLEGGPVTNQNVSGRCWLFATTNVLRVAVMKKYNLKEFELSQQYPFFWDKIERANWILTQIIDTADQDLSSRIVQELLKDPISDGGAWDMAYNLVNKYGLVPQTLYPDSYTAKHSAPMNQLLTSKLRENALKLRALANNEKTTASALQDAKAQMMREIHTIVTLSLGPPPKPNDKFTWEYYDANNKYHKVRLTPLEFARELSTPTSIRQLSFNVNELFSLVNDPRHKYLTHLTVNKLGNIVEGRPISYVNADMTTLKKAAIAMLKQGLPVWFGCDVGKSSGTERGLMDTRLYDYSLAFNVSLNMTKAQRLQTKESAMTHAMVLTAVHIENGKSVRWRVQNSWGPDRGTKGFYLMTDAWMDEYCYQVVTDPSHVSKEVNDVRKQKPVVLPLWDPLGALA